MRSYGVLYCFLQLAPFKLSLCDFSCLDAIVWKNQSSFYAICHFLVKKKAFFSFSSFPSRVYLSITVAQDAPSHFGQWKDFHLHPLSISCPKFCIFPFWNNVLIFNADSSRGLLSFTVWRYLRTIGIQTEQSNFIYTLTLSFTMCNWHLESNHAIATVGCN